MVPKVYAFYTLGWTCTERLVEVKNMISIRTITSLDDTEYTRMIVCSIANYYSEKK